MQTVIRIDTIRVIYGPDITGRNPVERGMRPGPKIKLRKRKIILFSLLSWAICEP